MKDIDILVVGELNADLILSGDVTPSFGQVEKLVDDATLTLGSSAAIFACGAARLGLRVAFVGVVGDDALGQLVVQSLNERGVDTGGMIVDAQIKTGLTVILSRGTDRAMLTYLGSIAALRYDAIDLALLEHARHLHLGSYFLLDALRPDVPRLFAAAHARGLTVSIDTNYDPTEQWDGGLAEALRHADIVLPNETELHAITRLPVLDEALQALAQQVPLVAVKLGARGAVTRRGDEIVRASVPAVTVVDTTGAGDTFDAGFVYGVLAGWDLKRALQFACVCGALSTRAAGGTAAQPTLDEALGIMELRN